MQVIVTMNYLPSLDEVEEAVVNVLGGPAAFHRLGPVMQRDKGVLMSGGFAVLSDFTRYTQAQTDAGRKDALELEVYREVISVNEDLRIRNLPVNTHKSGVPLDIFIAEAAQDGNKFVCLGIDLWREFCANINCQRLVRDKHQIPWVRQTTTHGMEIIPAMQVGHGFLDPIIESNQALTLRDKIYYNYDYNSVFEVKGHAAQGDEFLIDYIVGFDFRSGTIYNL